MIDLDGHRRHLAGLRAACATKPDLHRDQLAALDHELALAADGDLETYLAASGDVFELTRAKWLDRLAGQARVLVAIGDALRAEAVAEEYENALLASGHEDWIATISGGTLRTAEVVAKCAEATGAFLRMLLCLLEAHGGAPPADRPGWEEHARNTGEQLLAADPGFRLDDPPYGLRIPWTGRGRQRVAEWLDAVRGDVAAAVVADPLAEIERAAERWRASLHGTTKPPDAEPHDPAAAVAAAAQIARAEHALRRQGEWPDPLVAHHWQALAADLTGAGTATEVELIAFHADACFAIEADWNLLLQGSLGLPFRAAAAHDPHQATETAHALTGLNPKALAGTEPVRRVLARIAQDPANDPAGAFHGEAGFDVLNAARDAGITDPRGLTLPQGPPSDPRPVRLWSHDLALADLGSIAPRRPRL